MNEAYMLGAVFLGVSTLLNMAFVVTGIWANLKGKARNPPLSEELAKEYATKNELQNFRCEWQRICVAQHARIDDTVGKLFDLNRESEQRLAEWQRAVSIQLGKIEQAIRERSV